MCLFSVGVYKLFFKIFEFVLNYFGVKVEEVLYVGDNVDLDYKLVM